MQIWKIKRRQKKRNWKNKHYISTKVLTNWQSPDIRKLANDFLDFVHKYFDDDEKILEGLIVSVYWKLYSPKFSSLKEIIDYLEYIDDFNDQLPYLRKWEKYWFFQIFGFS